MAFATGFAFAGFAFDAGFFAGTSGEHDDGYESRGGVLTQGLKESEAIHLGHHDVGEDEIRRTPLNFFEGCSAVVGADNGEPGCEQ